MGSEGSSGQRTKASHQVAEVGGGGGGGGGGLGCGLETGRTVRRMQMMTSHNTTLQDKGL